MQHIKTTHLPDEPMVTAAYTLTPVDPEADYYEERVSRHRPWIVASEQRMLKRATIGIAGTGGMGGLLASTLVRLGVGEIRIADCEHFDISNINRQFGAKRCTLGQSKAFVTAREIRSITDDTTLMVLPQGINEDTVDMFLNGCDVVCDEIEFWAVGARVLLHERARARGIPIFNCNTVGFGTRLFLFEPQGYTMETLLGFDLQAANVLQEKIQTKTATKEEVMRLMQALLAGLVPELPEYSGDDPRHKTREQVLKRLLEEQTAPIIATNPVLAAGFLADWVLLYLLEQQGEISRSTIKLPPAPGYLYFDAALMQARSVTRSEVQHAV